MRLRWFAAGFAACYVFASICTAIVLFASQRLEWWEAAAVGPRWPLTVLLAVKRETWLRNRAPA